MANEIEGFGGLNFFLSYLEGITLILRLVWQQGA
jgi:hypothetical protein